MFNRDYLRGMITGTAGAIAAVIILQLSGTHVFSVGEGVLSKNRNVTKIEHLEEMIDQNYLGDIDQDLLAEGMYAGLLAGLNDPYSRYYTAEQYEEEMTYSDGAYVGIGVVMELNSAGGARIQTVYENAPGERAGLVAGDLIVAIDGKDITEEDLTEIADQIRHCEKDQVVLTIYHKDADQAEDITVEISNVEMIAVESEMLDNQVGYIRILEFTGVAPAQYEAAFADLKAQGMERLVIDLRDNPGGLLNAVCSILENILPEGKMAYIEDKYGNQEDILCEGEHPLTMPLVVLVNEGSASASELFAGAVKDYEVGTIVGTTTFGKGIVQSIQPLQDGSAVKLTIAEYFTPKGNSIHKLGVKPDVGIRLDDALLNKSEISKDEDNQLQEALKILSTDHNKKVKLK